MLRKILFIIGYLLPALLTAQDKIFTYAYGAVIRGDSAKKEIALVFTADEFGEGLPAILNTLKKENTKASFFFTGRFYQNKSFRKDIERLNAQGHYLGPHSAQHLLYCDWNKRDSLLVTKDSFVRDMKQNQMAMQQLQLPPYKQKFFIPPFEWWNDSIAAWSKQMGLILFNFTPGIRTAVDYTWPALASYKSSDWVVGQLKQVAETKPDILNGAVILIHAGTDPRRKDKLYRRLQEIIRYLKRKGYQFKRIDSLLATE